MPYTLKFYLYLFVAGVIVTVISVWLRPYGLLANLAFAFIAAYFAVIIGRRVLGRKHL